MASYVPSTKEERQEMLYTVGVSDYRELYRDVPAEMYLEKGLNLPDGMSELEVRRKMAAMAAKNKVFSTVLRGAAPTTTISPALSSTSPPRRSSSPPIPPTRRR